MSVTRVIEQAATEIELPKSEPLRNTRRFCVLCSTPTEKETAVIKASGIPRHGAKHPTYWSTVDSIRATKDEEQPTVWWVDVSYKGISLDDKERGAPEGSSLERKFWEPPKVRIGTVQYTEPFTKDIEGKPVVNTVGDQFDPLPTRIASYLSVTISRYEADNARNYVNIPQYLQTVNLGRFWGMAQDCVLLYDADGERIFDSDMRVFYWNTTYVFHVRPDGWQKSILNQGFHEFGLTKSGSDYSGVDKDKLVRIADANGDPLSAPSLLSAAGFSRQTTKELQGLSGITPFEPHYLKFPAYKRRMFNALQLPELRINF
jgi:hypothetical protein